MSKRILILTALSCALVAQAQAHELAYSKAEQVRVMVPGEPTDWCKPTLDMTIERPAWETKESLDRLLAKIPFILKQECPTASVNWKAVDANGVVYANGNGNAQSLGDVQLANVVEPEPTSAAQKVASVAEVKTPTTKPSEVAGADEAKLADSKPAEVKTDTVAVSSAHAPVVETVEPVKDVEPSAASEEVVKHVTAPEQADTSSVEVAQLSAPEEPAQPSDMGRSVLLDSGLYAEVVDNTGCKWLLRTTEVPDGADNYSLTQEGASCVAGYAVGPVKSLNLVSNSGGRPAWTRALHVHPSGMILDAKNGPSLDKLPLAIINHDATTGVFEAGKIADPDMKLYVYFYRNRGDWAMRPFNSGVSFVAETVDEKWALDEKTTFYVVDKINQEILANYQGKRGFTPLIVTTDIKKVFQQGRTPNYNHITINGHLSEAQSTKWSLKRNFYAQRYEQAERVARQLAQERATFHESVLRDYKSMQEEMESKGLSEHLFAAKKLEIVAELPSALDMMNPSKASRMILMLVKVDEREGDYYELTHPTNTRLYTEIDMTEGWHILPVALLTPSMELEDGMSVNAFKSLMLNDVEPCATDFCTEHLSIGEIFSKRYMRGSPDPMVDWKTWTPEVSQNHVDKWAEMNASSATN